MQDAAAASNCVASHAGFQRFRYGIPPAAVEKSVATMGSTKREPPAELRLARSLGVLLLFALVLSFVVAGIAFLRALGSEGVIILAAVLLAYIILPAVAFLRRYVPALVAVIITYAIFAALVALVFFIIVPPLVEQARALVASTPSLVQRLTQELASPNNRLVARLPVEVRTYLIDLPSMGARSFSTYGVVLAQRTLGVVLSTLSLALSLIIVPILAAYLFFETSEVKRAAVGFVPPRARAKTLAIVADLSDAIGAFVRGQVLDGAIVAVLISLMLWILHVPYALLIGVVAGFLNLVPYLGAVAGFIPSVLLALSYNGWQNALAVAILFGVIQQVDGTFILPRIMKANVSLSPLVIIVSILIGSALFGILGTFLAVPVAAMLRVLKIHFAPAPPAGEMTELEARAKTMTVFATPK